MPALIAFRNQADPGTDDLMWPSVTGDLLIRLEPDEVIRWRGTATVAEARRGTSNDEKWELIWRLTGSADVLITDRRITYRGHDVHKGTGQLAAAVADLGQPSASAAPSVLTGQVRFQWLAAILLARASGRNVWGVSCASQDGKAAVRLVLGFDEATGGAAAEAIAAQVTADTARFRLLARAQTLKAQEIRQLTAQRDNPTPVLSDDGSTRTWLLKGGLKIGGSADIRPPQDPVYSEALAAIEQYQASGDLTLLDKSLQLVEALLEDQSVNAHSELIYLNFVAGALNLRYQRHGDLSDLARCIDTQRKAAERAVAEAPDLAAGCFHNLGGALLERFKRALDFRDLADGVAAHEQAVAATASESDDWADHLDGLATALRVRYMTTRDTNDLDQAVTMIDQALSATPPDSQDVPARLVNLSNALTMRYDQVDDRNDLSRAVSTGQRAVQLMPRKSMNRSTALLSLALSLGKLYEADRESAHLQAAVPGANRRSLSDQPPAPAAVIVLLHERNRNDTHARPAAASEMAAERRRPRG